MSTSSSRVRESRKAVVVGLVVLAVATSGYVLARSRKAINKTSPRFEPARAWVGINLPAPVIERGHQGELGSKNELQPSGDEQRPFAREVLTFAPRAPLCADVAARIVSQRQAQEDSLASLSSGTEQARVVHVGSRFGTRQVIAIGYDRGRMSPSVLLYGKGGVCQAMTFEKTTAASANVSQSRHPSTQRKPSRHTEVVIERSAADAILERAFELTQTLRVAPALKNGEVAGMRLLGVRPDSLAEKLGFENGDTIERVNGVALNSPEAALSLYANLRSMQRLDIQVNRAGRPTTIEIRVN